MTADPDSPRGARVRPRLRIAVTGGGRPALARWLRRVAPRAARGAVAVALVGDARMRALNRRFRGVDRVTDVLAFPMDDPDSRSPAPELHLGDVVIATGRARRQAREAGHALDAELRVLALHGLLHLLGYDHDDAREARRMARAERRLRRQGGLRAGLLERAAAPPARSARRKGARR